MNRPTIAALLLVLGVAPLALSCAVNPATGQRQLSLYDESQEIALGRQAAAGVAPAFGLYGDEALDRYVAALGEALAERSERPGLPWSFQVVDDPAVNAFALPGGFLYVTRGILAHFDSEAELAAVLGHEIGHVTARHGVHQASKAQLAQAGLGLGAVLAPDFAPLGDLAGLGLGLLFLKHGRDDERQADELGLRYLTAAGYPSGAMLGVFEMLAAVSAGGSGGRMPDWLSTHPSPEERRERIARVTGGALPSAAEAGHDAYLGHLEGLRYGPNPREGFFLGSRFVHPDFALEIDFPESWKTQNGRQAVLAQSPQDDAILRLAAAEESTPGDAARAFFAQQSVQGVAGYAVPRHLNAAGGAFEVVSQGTTIRGVALFAAHHGQVFSLLAYTLAERWTTHRSAIERTLASFHELEDPELLAVQPMRIELVTLRRETTLSDLAARWDTPVAIDELALLNRVEAAAPLPAGSIVKRVTGFNPAATR